MKKTLFWERDDIPSSATVQVLSYERLLLQYNVKCLSIFV